jgi:hypothetical protein
MTHTDSRYDITFNWAGGGRRASISGSYRMESVEDIEEMIKLLKMLHACRWLEQNPTSSTDREVTPRDPD